VQQSHRLATRLPRVQTGALRSVFDEGSLESCSKIRFATPAQQAAPPPDSIDDQARAPALPGIEKHGSAEVG